MYELKQAGLSLKAQRKLSCMTQQELADKVGVDAKTISNIENGKTSPTIYMACKIADALGTTLDNAFGRIA